MLPNSKCLSPGLFKRLPLFTLSAGIALVIGFIVPTIYEWTQKSVARSLIPPLELAAAAALVLTMIGYTLNVWLGRREEVQTVHRTGKCQFGLRGLFAVTTLAAIAVAIARWFDASLANASVAAVALVIAGWSFCHDWHVRARTGALLASLFFPFAWMIAFNEPFGRTSGLAVNIPIGPAILPAELIRSLIDGVKVDDMETIAAVIVVVQLVVGSWLAARGGKLSVAYTLTVLGLSSLSSLVMHAMYRT